MQFERQIQNLALVGFMGTGKTSVGRLAASALHFEFLDTDEQIETISGRAVETIFKEDGEAAFRQQETALVQTLGTRTKTVISCGGGLVISQANLDSLKAHSLVVCLWARPETVYERVRSQTHRPLLNGPDPLARIRELLAAREAQYRKADVLLGTDFRSMREAAQHIVHEFRMAQRAASRV